MKGHVTQYLDEIRQRVEAAPSLALFLDFDGTLAPLADHPADVYLDRFARARLRTFITDPDFMLAVLSGREIMDLQERIDLSGLVCAGNHGLEIRGPDCAFMEPTIMEHRTALKDLTDHLNWRLREIPGVCVENKVLSAAVHYHGVADVDVAAVRKLVHAALAKSTHPFRLTTGDKVFDIRPRVDWDKGDAVRWIRAHAAAPDALAIYLGDDATDEDAFASLPDDITIKVGDHSDTLAQYNLENAIEVQEFLGWLADERITSRFSVLETASA